MKEEIISFENAKLAKEKGVEVIERANDIYNLNHNHITNE
jgi:hypothetical protein